MSDNDLSDEAYLEWRRQWLAETGMHPTELRTFQHWRDVAYERIKEAYRAGYSDGIEMGEAGLKKAESGTAAEPNA